MRLGESERCQIGCVVHIDVKMYYPEGVPRTHGDACGLCDSMIRREWWWMVEVKGSRHKPKVPKSITGWLGDLYVTGFVINQCMRSLKKHRELIRDVLRTEPLTPVVLLEQLPSCSFACKRKYTINRENSKCVPRRSLFRPYICSLLFRLLNLSLLGFYHTQPWYLWMSVSLTAELNKEPLF